VKVNGLGKVKEWWKVGWKQKTGLDIFCARVIEKGERGMMIMMNRYGIAITGEREGDVYGI